MTSVPQIMTWDKSFSKKKLRNFSWAKNIYILVFHTCIKFQSCSSNTFFWGVDDLSLSPMFMDVLSEILRISYYRLIITILLKSQTAFKWSQENTSYITEIQKCNHPSSKSFYEHRVIYQKLPYTYSLILFIIHLFINFIYHTPIHLFSLSYTYSFIYHTPIH